MPKCQNVSSKDENLVHAMNYQIFQAMVQIASIAVLAMASDYMEDDEDEVDDVYELGWEVWFKLFARRAAAQQLLKALFQISLQDFLLGEGTSVLFESLCSHAAAFPCQLRSVSLRYSPCKENKIFRRITTCYGFLYSTEAPIEPQEKTYISNGGRWEQPILVMFRDTGMSIE